jgi:hypothetical protein
MAVFTDSVFQSFVAQRPIATATQMILRRLLAPQALDQLFRDNAQSQYEQTLLFSALTRMMAAVVLGMFQSVNAACKKMQRELLVSTTAVYNKLQRIETQTMSALVRYAYQQTMETCRELGGVRQHDVAGYTTRILDGNHLSKTEHRLKETRALVAGPLPGKSLVVFDPRFDAVSDYFPIEDGHAQELSALDAFIATLARQQLVIADRNFCTLKLLYAIAAHSSCFVIRQHAKLKGRIVGQLKRRGKTDTAIVYENKLQLPGYEGETLVVRRIVACLHSPTRDGDTEVVLLTNLPTADADAMKVSELYRTRWKIETAFMHMTLSLQCEVSALCYPAAALFCFATALVGYNAWSIVKALVAKEHGRPASAMLSHYYLAAEIASTTDGLLIAVPEAHWTAFAEMKIDEFVECLQAVARSIDLSLYRKSVRGPKKPPPKKKGNKRTVHVSTQRILEKRREK